MPEPTRELLHDAAPAPTDVPDFADLWGRARRRRRLIHGLAAVAAVAVFGLAAGVVMQLVQPPTGQVRFVDQPPSAGPREQSTLGAAETARQDWELAKRWIGPFPPMAPRGTPPASIAGNEKALNRIQAHFEAVVHQKMQQAPVRSDGSRGVGLTPEEGFTVTSTDFRRCIETYAGPDEAGPAKPAPRHLQHYRRVSIRPRLDTIDSCHRWFAVDVYVDADGNVKGAVLDRYRP